MKAEKKIIFEAAREEVRKLKIGNYHTRFLTYMVYHKVRHPGEKMDELAKRSMDSMAKLQPKTTLKTSAQKSLEAAEEALDGSATISEEMFAGKPVKNVVKTLAQRVIAKVMDKSEEDEE